jgi:hypothetical protein
LDRDRRNSTVDGALNLERSFVGLDFNDNIPAVHYIAGFDSPLHDAPVIHVCAE